MLGPEDEPLARAWALLWHHSWRIGMLKHAWETHTNSSSISLLIRSRPVARVDAVVRTRMGARPGRKAKEEKGRRGRRKGRTGERRGAGGAASVVRKKQKEARRRWCACGGVPLPFLADLHLLSPPQALSPSLSHNKESPVMDGSGRDISIDGRGGLAGTRRKVGGE